MATIEDLEHRVRLAEEAVEGAFVAKNEASVKLHSYRLRRASEALTAARHADELSGPGCGCGVCP